MASESEYVRRVRGMDRNAIKTLWEQVEARDTPDWEAGKAFEYTLLRAYELEGASVRYPFSVKVEDEVVEQLDGAIYTGRLAVLVEAKDHSDRVDIQPIAKLRNQLLRRPASVIGAVFAREGFTDPAPTLAQYLAPQTILLWQGDEITYAMRNAKLVDGLHSKFDHCVAHAAPDFNILLMENA